MVTVYFPQDDTVLTFDGAVLEAFYPDYASQRIHVHHIQSIQVSTDRKGKRQLNIKTTLNDASPTFEFDSQLDASVNDLVMQVQQAKASLQF